MVSSMATAWSKRSVSTLAVALGVALGLSLSIAGTPALAAGEPHPLQGSFERSSGVPFTSLDGIAVDEASGDVYVTEVGVDEQQTVTLEGGVEGGSFTLEFEGQTTEALDITTKTHPSAGAVRNALRKLSTIGPPRNTDVNVTKSGTLPGTVVYTVTFTEALASTDVPQITCDGSALTGSPSPMCTVATITPGYGGKIYKFDAAGTPVDFASLGSNELEGSTTPLHSFSFPPQNGNPAAIAVDNACAQHEPELTGAACAKFDPSAGDLYVMNPTHKAVDKFSADGEYLGQITATLAGAALYGIGVDGKGDLRVHGYERGLHGDERDVEVFDKAATNAFVSNLLYKPDSSSSYGFAVAPNGDMYLLGRCGCLEKLGGYAEPLGQVDGNEVDVAAAVDPLTGHVYVDDQSSVVEWDTGTMNGDFKNGGFKVVGAGAQVATFGSTDLVGNSSGYGGIGVDGRTGKIYVTSPANGKIYVYGTESPAATPAAATNVTKTTATLNGAVEPRGATVTSCRFEYEAPEYEIIFGTKAFLTAPASLFQHSVPCMQTSAEIGSGTTPVPVSAEAVDLQAGRLYDVRLVVENAAGASFAGERFATEGKGFGFKGVEVAFLKEDGALDTQAGSHPYEMLTSIELNTKVVPRERGADALYSTEPDGSVRDILTNLPPGLVGDPNATEKKCMLEELEVNACPEDSQVGVLEIAFGSEYLSPNPLQQPVYNMVPPRGVAVQLGINLEIPNAFIDSGVIAGGDYQVQAAALNIPALVPLVATKLRIHGIVGSGAHRKPFLTLPTGCSGPLKTSFSADSYQHPGQFVEETSIVRGTDGQPVSLTGCSKLQFPPTITVRPDTTNASTASGLSVNVHLSQKGTLNPDGVAESALRDTTVTLPQGVAIDPSGADGLQACSEALAGFTGFKEFNPDFEPGQQTATFTSSLPQPLLAGTNFCPDGSKIGTVNISTPLLEHELEGAVYLAAQGENPFGSLIAMYLIAEEPESGTVIKLTGEVALSDTGQIVTTFKNTPDLPFEDLTLHFFGGERAPLAMPAHCGIYTTDAVFTPWDGNPPVHTESSFTIDHGPNGGPCPGARLPFNPTLDAGLINNQAGTSSPFTMTMSRGDGEQSLQAISMAMPPGVMGSLTGVKLCGEAQANAGTCGSESLIGETTVSVGLGNDPFTVKGGKVYLTGAYDGAPFGLSIVNPAKAGPYDLEQGTACDCIVVRAKVEVNPLTAQLTVSSDNGGPYAIPTILKGIPLQIKHVNVTIDRPGFMLNPTSCEKMHVVGTLFSAEGSSQDASVPLQVANCAKLPFKPRMLAFTKAHHTRKSGAYLHVVMKSGQGQVGLREVHVELPKALPSVLKTLQQACTEAQFEKDPAGCPEGSVVGRAVIHTPVLPVPLKGKAYFVSHGGAKFPELVIVLHGYGVTIQLNGETFISKSGVTSSTFKSLPDVPFNRFDLILPRGKHPALTGNGDLCSKRLKMPTRIVAQSGKLIERSTTIKVHGCKPYLKVVGKHVSKGRATIVVKVAPAGKLVVDGAGIKRIVRTVHRAGRVRLKLRLTRHDKRVLAGHRHRRLKLSLDLGFQPKHRSELHERVTVLMR